MLLSEIMERRSWARQSLEATSLPRYRQANRNGTPPCALVVWEPRIGDQTTEHLRSFLGEEPALSVVLQSAPWCDSRPPICDLSLAHDLGPGNQSIGGFWCIATELNNKSLRWGMRDATQRAPGRLGSSLVLMANRWLNP